MEAYAVVETGGKQYRVEKDSVLTVEKLDAEAGSQVEFSKVLAVSDGTTLTVGTPVVDHAVVKVTVVEQCRGDKVVAFKKKRRKGYKRKVGHRQDLTKVQVSEISAG
jgi:large subunit ribosomal protein L21